MIEKWKDIKNYEGIYQISNLGRVRSLDRYIIRKDGVTTFEKGGLRLPKINSDGYYIITLSKNGMDKTIAVHILVARHFVKNSNNKPEVNHRDFNRKNNVFNNLEWCTHKENVAYSSMDGRYKNRDFNGKNNPNFGNHKLSEFYKANSDIAVQKLSRKGKQNGRATKIQMYDKNMNYIKTFEWIGECVQYLMDNEMTKSVSVNDVRSRIATSIRLNKTYLNHYYKKMFNFNHMTISCQAYTGMCLKV